MQMALRQLLSRKIVMEVMTNNILILTSFTAFAMITMAAAMIGTQEAYAATIEYVVDTFCGKNYQGSFHLGVGNPSLSIPPG